jgi:3-deoxy-D-manno-octulosonic acid (KDO) 8-phosphate synthase
MSASPTREIPVADLRLGGSNGLFLIAGPCVIESEAHTRTMAEGIAAIAAELKIPFIFKISYDKANRTSGKSYRGPGVEEGLRILRRLKDDLKLPLLTDVHEPGQVAAAAEVADILQIPAFLSRQTDLLTAAGKSGRAVNIKKGQFVSPWEMKHAVEKVTATGNEKILLTERGSSFGYNRSSLTSPTPCNSPAGRGTSRAACASSPRRSPAPLSLPVWMASSSKSTTTRRRPSPTPPPSSPSPNSNPCSKTS